MARRHIPEEPENHERWLVSYADFITLLFAFFVVMYAISQVNEGKYRVLSDALVQAFNRTDTQASQTVSIQRSAGSASPRLLPSPFKNASQAKYEAALKERKQQEARMKSMAVDLRSSLSNLIDQGQVRVTESKRGIAVEINAALLFPVGSATLDAKAGSALAAIAQKIAATDNLIQVGGHTDNVPISSPQFPSNWELSAARAGTVVRLFESSGVAPNRLVAIGYADNRPKDSNDSAEGRAANRRVTVEILADNKDEVATLPLQGDVPAAKP